MILFFRLLSSLATWN